MSPILGSPPGSIFYMALPSMIPPLSTLGSPPSSVFLMPPPVLPSPITGSNPRSGSSSSSQNKRSFALSSGSSSAGGVSASSSEPDSTSFANQHIQPVGSTPRSIGVTSVEVLMINRDGGYIDADGINPILLTSPDVKILTQVSQFTTYKIDGESFLYSVGTVAYAIITVYRDDMILPYSSGLPQSYLHREILMKIASDFSMIRKDRVKATRSLRVQNLAARRASDPLIKVERAASSDTTTSSEEHSADAADKVSAPLDVSGSLDVREQMDRLTLPKEGTVDNPDNIEPILPKARNVAGDTSPPLAAHRPQHIDQWP